MPSPPAPSSFVARPLNASRENLLARYLGVQLTALPAAGEPAMVPATEGLAVLLPNQVVIKAQDNEVRVGSIGHCIYCASGLLPSCDDSVLTGEHIVARGWGGTIVLEDSCCPTCQKHINEEIEAVLLGTIFLALRRRLNIKSRKRKGDRREDGFEARTVAGGKIMTLKFGLDDHPTILLLIAFNLPIAIGGVGGPAKVYVHQFDSYETAAKQGLDNIMSYGFDTVRFSQMLAKIAHGYACWRVGLDKFQPYLSGFILRKFEKGEQYPECYELVGGDPRICKPSEPDVLHQMGHSFVERNGKRLLIVGIRLLANLSGPIYWVVAGEMV